MKEEDNRRCVPFETFTILTLHKGSFGREKHLQFQLRLTKFGRIENRKTFTQCAFPWIIECECLCERWKIWAWAVHSSVSANQLIRFHLKWISYDLEENNTQTWLCLILHHQSCPVSRIAWRRRLSECLGWIGFTTGLPFTLAQTPTMKDSIFDSSVPLRILKYPSSPHLAPHELAHNQYFRSFPFTLSVPHLQIWNLNERTKKPSGSVQVPGQHLGKSFGGCKTCRGKLWIL